MSTQNKMSFWSLQVQRIVVAAVALVIGVDVFGAGETVLKVRQPHAKPSRELMRSERYNQVATLKFREGTHVRFRNGKLHAETGGLTSKELSRLTRSGLHPAVLPALITRVNGTLSRYHAEVARRFSRSEAELNRDQEEGERRSKRELADLNLYYTLRFERSSAEEMIDALESLNGLEIVEFARPMLQLSLTYDDSPATPSYTSDQDYLGSSPLGLGITSVWPAPGGRGDDMRFADVEVGWLAYHEDLPAVASVSGYNSTTPAYVSHSTAVRGILNAGDNAYGVTGIASQATVYASSVLDANQSEEFADAIDTASSQLLAGQIIVVEVAVRCVVTPFRECPLEYDGGAFDAISTATANGRVVVEGAGNSATDLDQIVVGGNYLFDRNYRDSEAIIVGAGTASSSHNKLSFSSFGDRVDVQGWGEDIVTTGYGDLFAPSGDVTQFYTSVFGGTSGATAMIAGAAGIINSIRDARELSLLDSAGMRSALLTQAVSQGDPQNGNIGPFPNVAAVVAAIPLSAPSTTAVGSATSVTVTWGAVPGVADYRIYRASSGSAPSWTLVGTTSALTLTDTSVTAGQTYMYAVRSRDGAGNESAAPGFPDLATTTSFTDTVLQDPILATYMVELRGAANKLCQFAGSTICGSAPYSGNDLVESQVKQQLLLASYFKDVWDFADAIRTAVGAKSEARIAAEPAAGNAIYKQHVYDLRRIVN